MDTAQWPQDIMVRPMEEIGTNSCPKQPSVERKVRPHKEQASNCPRCNSTNTKFCYYNNYSLSQPRYFCKTCRRYWTEGGTLRNIPVGGGTRKNKRSSSNISTSANSSKKLPDLVTPTIPQQNPKIHETQDLNLGFTTPPDFKTITELIQVPNFENGSINRELGLNPPTCSSSQSALELLSNGITAASRGLSTFMPMTVTTDPNTVYSSSASGFSLPEFRPSLNFSLDGLRSNYGSFQGVQETNGKLLFPFEDLKQVSSNADDAEHNREEQGDSTGYWNGVMGGGSW